MTHLRHAKGSHAILDNQYSYNTASQIIHNAGVTETRAYDYDLVDRLTSVTTDDSLNEEYTYDGVGNRLTSFSNIGDYTYGPFNRLSNVGHKPYEFNDDGNLISGPYPTLAPSPHAWSEYAYDFENRLTQVTLAWRGALFFVHRRYINYKYDALGRRVERNTSDGEVEKFVYDGQDVIEDLNANGEVIRTYLNGPGIDDKIRQTDENGDLYFTSDHLGSTATLTDADGEEVEQITYDSFGKSEGSGLTRFTYTGREFDADTGLYYYRARWYDPQLGRFISEDPIGFGGDDINLYGFVWQNPLNFSDPYGLDGWGNNTADWLDGNIGYAQRWWQPDPDAVNWNTAVNFISNCAFGASDLFRVGNGTGQALFSPDENGYGRAAFVLEDVSRGANIFLLLAGPAAGYTRGGAATCECTSVNTNPFNGPVSRSVTAVGPKGDAIRLAPGEQLAGSPSGEWLQVKDGAGTPTGVRLDGPHRPSTHPDLRAQRPHAHVPGLSNADGTPWLPSK